MFLTPHWGLFQCDKIQLTGNMKTETIKHTPGPWHVAQYGDGLPSETSFFAVKIGAKSLATGILGEPDARLIAAAPELLEACKAALDAMELHGDSFYDTQAELLRAAISKATT